MSDSPSSSTSGKPSRAIEYRSVELLERIEQPKSQIRVLSLIDAVRRGSLEKVEQSIREGVKINQQDKNQKTALHYAVKVGPEMVASIVDYYDKKLRYAIKNSYPYPENIFNIKDNEGNTPLHYAVRYAKPDYVLDMLLRGADPSIENNIGVSPASYRAVSEEGKPGVSAASHRAIPEDGKEDGELKLIEYVGSQTIRSMVTDERFRDPSYNKQMLRTEYLRKIEDEKAYVRDLQYGVEDATKMSQEHVYSKIRESFESKSIIGTAIAVRPLPEPRSAQERFEQAIQQRNYSELERVLTSRKAEIDINANLLYGSKKHPRNALMMAVKNDDRKLLSILLHYNANINAADKDGNTVLHYAASSMDSVVVQTLVERGARLDAKNKKGETPLHIVADYGFPEIKHLPSSEQTKASELHDDTTPAPDMLHYRLGPSELPPQVEKYNSATKLFNYLILAGANPFEPNRSGKTPNEIILGKVGIKTDDAVILTDPILHYSRLAFKIEDTPVEVIPEAPKDVTKVHRSRVTKKLKTRKTSHGYSRF